MDYNSVIFTDEVEIKFNPENNQNLGLHFNGIYFDNNKALCIKHDLEPIVDFFGVKGFHAKNVFKEKSDTNYDIMSIMTDIIIRNQILWLNFPFAKSSMKSEGLKPFFEMDFLDMDYQKSNYRAVAFFLYFHSIHYYQEKYQLFNPKIRIYSDKDQYLKYGTEFYHKGKVLYNIERILSTRGSSEPFLYLADLVGFMFGRVKTKVGKNILNVNVDDLDQLTKLCLFNTQRIVLNNQFRLLNFWELIPSNK